jgi:hypothetical protein
MSKLFQISPSLKNAFTSVIHRPRQSSNMNAA